MIHALHCPVTFDPDVLDGVLRTPRVAARIRTSAAFDPDGFDGVLRISRAEASPVNVDAPTRELPDLETVISMAHPVRPHLVDPLRSLLDTPAPSPPRQPMKAAVVHVPTPVPITSQVRGSEHDNPSSLSGSLSSLSEVTSRSRSGVRPSHRALIGPAVLSLGAGAAVGLAVLFVVLGVVVVWSFVRSPPEPVAASPAPVADMTLASVGRIPPPPVAPVNAESIVLPARPGETIVFPGSFAINSVVPDGDYSVALGGLVARFSECARVGVTGHTDGIGTPEVNEIIGRARGQVVASELKKAGLPPERIDIRTEQSSTRRVVLSCDE